MSRSPDHRAPAGTARRTRRAAPPRSGPPAPAPRPGRRRDLCFGWRCLLCGDDAEVAELPADQGFSPDERICLRCGDALLRPGGLLVTAQGRSA